MKFESTPLLTPERLKGDLIETFSILPNWITTWAVLLEPDTMGDDSAIVCVFGRKHRMPCTMTPPQLAYLLEMCRLGHSVVTNSNHGKPVPKIYARLMFRDAPEDMMSLPRLFVDAGPHEAVTTVDILSDLRIGNLIKFGAGKPNKQSRDVTMQHVERLLDERTAGGTLPVGFDPTAYLENIEQLHQAMLDEAKLT